MKPILYSYFRSSSSYRVRIALSLKKIDYEYRAVHLIKDGGEQLKPEFKTLNPMGQVPYLIHDQVQISQSMAILLYLESAFPNHPLFPKDNRKFAKLIELCEIINSGIQPVQNLGVLKKLEEDLGATAAQKKLWAKTIIETGLEGLEKAVGNYAGRYAFGDKVSALDCFLVPQLFNARRFEVDTKHFPNLYRADENARALPAFASASPEAQPDFKA